MRKLFAAFAMIALPTLSLEAQCETVLVEDWSAHSPGSLGVPEGWQGQNWGKPAYDLTVVAESPPKVLQLKSRGDSSVITKEVKVDLRETPILEWRWKVVTLPAGADARSKTTDDQAIQLYVTWERPPRLFRSRIIGYIWDSTAPEGSIIRSQKNALVIYVVVRSGAKNLGEWLSEARNVYEDYRRIYEEEPDVVDAISIAIDSDDTKSSAESYVGTIRFRKP